MPQGLLWLGFSLLGVLKIETQDTTPNLIPAPSLLSLPLQPNFQADQFQGKWYVVGLAGNIFSREEQGEYKMYSDNLQLKEDRSYNVTSILLNSNNQDCDYFISTLLPGSQPGDFKLGNIEAYLGLKSYTVRVVTANYNEFAILVFKSVYPNLEMFKITLYGRTKELTPERKEEFIRISKSLGLSDDHILFPVPIDKCIDG